MAETVSAEGVGDDVDQHEQGIDNIVTADTGREEFEFGKSLSGPSTPSSKEGKGTAASSVLLRRVYSDVAMNQSISENDGPENLKDYEWPPESGNFFILQEHVSRYLGVLSFKRKYPNIYRHVVDAKEKRFLLDSGTVTPFEADLGLAALKLDELMSLMKQDYPHKYKEYMLVIEERRKKRINERYDNHKAKATKPKMAQMRKRAMKSCTDFNKRLNVERAIERPMSLNMQTWLIEKARENYELSAVQSPVQCGSDANFPAVSSLPDLNNTTIQLYPIALIPGQYQSYYKKYSSGEMFTLPLRSALREAPTYKWEEGQDDGEYITDSDESDISELSIDSDISDGKFEEAAELAFSSPSVKEVKLTDRQKELIQEQHNKQQEQAKEDEQDCKQKQQLKEKAKKGGGEELGETKFQKWLKTQLFGKNFLENLATSPKLESGNTSEGLGGDSSSDFEQQASTMELSTNAQSSPSASSSNVSTICKVCKVKYPAEHAGDWIRCSCCQKVSHPKCLDITAEMLPVVKSYNWQCMDCKTCLICMAPHDEDKMIFCDVCDRGFHTFCISLPSIPTGRWVCNPCGECTSCGTKQPSKSDANAFWQHKYTHEKDGDDSPQQHLTTLCATCSRLWEDGHFCPLCLKCFEESLAEETMMSCNSCDRLVHFECEDLGDSMRSDPQTYTCAICRGDKNEKCDRFHRKYKIQRYVAMTLKNAKAKRKV